MKPFVSQAVVLPRKHLAADFTTERLLSRVNTLVRLQPGLLGERLPAFEAPKRFEGLVGGLVLLQLRQAGETLVAHRADEEFLICPPHIHGPFCSQVVSTEDVIFCVRCGPLRLRQG